ncbi:MAG: Imm74 family immunity protein [Planctomycetota bacterium]
MLTILLQYMLGFFLQIILGMTLSYFLYKVFSRIYLNGIPASTSISGMLKEDRLTSAVFLITAIFLLGITIIIHISDKPLFGFYLVSFFFLAIGSAAIFPPKGRKITKNCYVMIFHRDHFIVTLNGHKIYIRGERLRGNPDQIIYKEQFPKWLPPHESEPVSKQNYEYILNAVLKFLEKIKKQGVIK